MSHYDFDVLTRVRLEIEASTTGLTNMISNSSGALGAWGWITPAPNSVLLSQADYPSGTLLEYRAPNPSAASYLWSEPMRVDAGQYVGAKWDVPFISGYYRARLEWLNLNGSVVALGTQTGFLQTGAATIAATVVPATVAFVRLRFDTYSNTAANNPGSAAQFQFKNVVVAKASTAAGLGVTRTNLLANPSFEVNTAEWTAGVGANISRSTAQAFTGSASLAIAATGGKADASTSLYGITPGRDYTTSVYVKAGSTRRQVFITHQFYDEFGTVATLTSLPGLDNTTGWTRYGTSVTAPAGATSATITIGVTDAANGELHYLDAVMTEEGFGVRPFITGSLAAQFLGVVALGFVNIMGPAHEISTHREGLDLGTLTATIRDTALDPATASVIRPGRRVRLMALTDDGTWQPLFTGKAKTADVTYDLTAKPRKSARISLVAVDPAAPLANATRPSGVANITSLPYVLEGCSIPWSVNGSGNQVATAAVVSDNDNATALDQIAITRDSASGFAWVDRAGVLQAWDRDYVPSALPNGSASGDKDRARVTTQAQGGTPTTTYQSAVYRTAPDAFQMTASAAGTQQYMGWMLQQVPVVAGRKYRLRGWVRSAAVSRRVGVYVSVAGGYGSSALDFSGGVVTTTTGWTLIDREIEISTFPGEPKNTTAFFGVMVAASTDPVLAGQPKLGANEVHYFDDLSVSPVLDERIYNPSLGVSFSSDECINEVNIKQLEWDPADPTKTIEVVYGPYRDDTSINTWDRHAKEFTVQGLTAAQVNALGASILARSSVPTVRITSIAIPITDTADLWHAILDLYGHVYVKNNSKALNQAAYITSIEHTLTPDGWLMDLGFSDPTGVASPTAAPPVQTSPGPAWAQRIQSGQANSSFGGAAFKDVTVVFPNPYPTGVNPIVLATGVIDPWNYSIQSVSNTQAVIRATNPGGASSFGFYFNWSAIA